MSLNIWHKSLFFVCVLSYILDFIIFQAEFSILSWIWILGSIVVFVMSIIRLIQKPKKKAFIITTLVLTSLITFFFISGIILGVLSYV